MKTSPSLHRFLLRRLLGPLLLIVVLDVIASYTVALHFVDEAYDRWLLDSARSLAHQVRSIKDKPTLELPSPAVELFRWDELDKTYFKVESAQSGLIAGDPSFPTPPLPASMEDLPLFTDGIVQDEDVRKVSVFFTPQESDERVMVTVGETLKKRRNIVQELLVAVVLPQLFLVLISILHVRRGIRVGLTPLAQLIEMIDKRSAQDLTPIATGNAPLEVTALTVTINALLEQLSSTLEGQKRFIANAAHQLRTPLAGLKLQTERLIRAAQTQEITGELKRIEASANRMTHLTGQLLALAQTESTKSELASLQEVDLIHLIRETTISWAGKAMSSGVELSLETTLPSAYIVGEPTLLAEMFSNLLENAILYGSSKKGIQVKVELVDSPSNTIGVSVTDFGRGIPSSERERVFERFYRIPGTEHDGCGLGLSIVREIADIHHAFVRISEPKVGGTRMDVVFPRIHIS